MLTKGGVEAGLKMLYVFALVLALHSSNVLGYGSAKEGKCPTLPADVNCAFKLLNSESESIPCYGQDLECLGDMKCCEDGCGGYECKPAIGLPPLPVIEPHCISAEVRVGDQCEPANITYCYADQCNSCCVHNSVCNPSSKHISLEECEDKLCNGIQCLGQGEICALDKYHRAVCRCRTECPPDTPNMPVCGSDGITYKNECEMFMTACVTGDWIRVVNQGSCQRNPMEICSMPKEKGFGWTLELKYYFNEKKGICEGFIYHGKGGNDNNFEKYKDCVDMCSGTVSNVCVLPKLVGPCRAAFPRWYFDSQVRRCQRFTYGGCAGNGNNFESEEECNNQCVCNLPKAPGICLGYFPSWFYNSQTETCEKFIYGGCHGNTNRFYSKERCQNSCGGGADDLLKPRCYGKGKFNCRSIKKCLSISKKCNGVDDCGDNSDEEGCDPCVVKKCDFYSTCVTTKNNTALCDCPTVCTADWSPVCGSDNETYPNLCTMQVESCQRQQLITKVSDGECGGRPSTKCEIHRDEQQSQMLVGVYIPQCEEDGSYSSTQCHGSTGYCWCVDGDGNKVVETEVGPGQGLNCTAGPLPTDPPVNICDITLCEFGRCVEVDGNATCQCNKICPLLYSPVCGTNNKTYVNPCVMDAEACEKKEHIRKQYSGECKMSPPTEGPLPTDPPFNICDITHCEFGRCIEVDGNATCQCNKICPFIYNPACGTNNKTYPNPCVMDAEACEKKELIQIQYSGECKEKIGVGNVIKDPCYDFECKYYATCVPLRNGSRLCECPQICTRELDPVCGSDGLTYSNPCEMRVASCEKQELITETHSGRCGVAIISGGPLSKCEKERAATEDRPSLIGAFIPQCEEDGSYSKVQCHGSTGYCWCVDGDGNKQMETEVGPGLRPNCTKEEKIGVGNVIKDPCHDFECKYYATCVPLRNGSRLCECPQICTRELDPVCGSDGLTYSNPCEMRVASCEKQELITETHSGKCVVAIISGGPLSKCEKERAAIQNRPLLIGAFIPQCEEDGSYSEVQCHGSTGYCWCVDGDGNKRKETEVGPGPRPNCTKDPCDISHCDFGVCLNENGTAKCVCNQACPSIEQPVCGSDNKTYANLCVMDAEACERKTHIKAKHNGPCGTKSKCQKELEMALARQQSGTFKPRCEEDGRYSPKQCHTSTGYCWCSTPQGEKILETQLRFKDPDCPKNIKSDPCASVECDFYGTCVALDNGDHICDCPRFCTKEYAPVCASNGKTYGNTCEMQVVSCAMQQMLFVESNGDCGSPTTTAPPFDPCDFSLCDFGVCVNENGTAKCICNQTCPFIEQPVCGSDNKTYANLCVMDAETCERKQRITVQNDGPCEEAVPTTGNNPCALIDCPFYSECELFNGNAKCVCAQGCTRELNPKCGSDNITYDNPCDLRRASCEAKKEITIVKDGECILPTTPLPTVAIKKRPPRCNNCPKFGEENVVSSFCQWYNKFAIIGEVLNTSKNGREITVKVETKYKPIAEKTKFIPKSTVRIKVQKISDCQCDNLEFKKNERYVFMGKKTKKRTFVIKWKTGFVEKVSKPLVEKLNKSLQRLKTWGFCVQRRSG